MTVPRLKAGDTWFLQLGPHCTVLAYELDEVTTTTVAMRRVSDLGYRDLGLCVPATRFAKADLIFLERIK